MLLGVALVIVLSMLHSKEHFDKGKVQINRETDNRELFSVGNGAECISLEEETQSKKQNCLHLRLDTMHQLLENTKTCLSVQNLFVQHSGSPTKC